MAAKRKRSRPRPPADPLLIAAFIALVFLGSVMVFSASAIWASDKLGDSYYFLKRHLMYLGMGAFAAYFALRVRPDFWRKSWFLLYAGVIALLCLTLVMGKTISGAKRWLYLGPFGFQISEMAKFALIVALARYADRYQSKLTRFKWAVVFPVLIYLVLAAPIMLQPDFGNTFVLGLVFFAVLMGAGIPGKFLALFPMAALPAAAALILAAPYRMRRIFGYLSVWRSGGVGNPSDASSYQLSQALLALGSGGILGKGLGDSDLKLHYLPQPHTDFIFPVIGEELGFIGSLTVILLFVIIAVRGVRAAVYAPTQFEKLLALGITFVFVFQAAIHMAVTTALVPTKGITLPFVSYGGSSLVVSCFMAGVLIRLSRSR